MRLIIKIVVTVLLALVGRLVVPTEYVAKHPKLYWSAFLLLLLVLIVTEKLPSLEERRKKRSRKLLSKRNRVLPQSSSRAYWGTAPSQIDLIGRERDEEDIWHLFTSGARVIGVFGSPGVGKSSLVANISRQASETFEHVLWHSLRSAPLLTEVLDRWLAVIGVTPLSDRLGERLDLLIAFLATNRCLIILDNAETVYDTARTSSVVENYAEYRELLERIITNSGFSTLIVTSTVLFDPFSASPLGVGLGILVLKGLSSDAVRSVLEVGGVHASKADAKKVEKAYSGNPQAVLILAEYVRDSYGGELSRLLEVESDLVNFDRFNSLLERQVSALSKEERLLLLWLVVWAEPVSLATLHRMLSDHLGFREPVSVGELIARLRSRHLVIDTAQGVTPPGFLLELVTHYLLHAIASEIVEGRPDLISTCPLSQASWPDRVREHQRTFLLCPLIDRIAKAEGLQIQSVKGLLRDRLRHLAQGGAMRQDYTVANVLYLMEAAGEEFVDLDLHELTIRGADFRPSWLHRSNLADTDLTGSAFAQGFGTLHSIALSPDAEAMYLAAGTSQGRVLVWLRENGELIAERQSHSEVVRSLCFAADSKSIYSGGEDGRLVAWCFGANKAEVVNEAHRNWIWSVDLAEDLQRLITTGGDGHVKLWDLDCLQEELAIRFPHPWIWSVVYSRGLLVCGSEDGSVWSCQIKIEGKRPHAVGQYRLESRFEYPVKSLSFSAQNPNVVLVGCTGGFIYSLDLASKEVQTFGPRHLGGVRSIVALPGRGLIASAGDDKLIRVWKAKDGSAVRLLEGHSSRIWSLSSHNTLPLIASASDDRSAKIWRTDGPTHPERSLYGVEHSVRSLDIDGSDGIIAACCDDVVRRWDGDLKRTDNVIVNRHARLTVARAVGQTYIAAADDGSISVRAGEEPLRSWAAHEGAIECLRIERYRGIIASGGEDRVVRLWSIGGDLLAELSYHRNRIWDLAFSPNGQYLITGGGDHAVGLWTVDEGQLHATLLGHQNLVLAVSWLSDDVFVSGSCDGTVRFWKIGANANGIAELTKVIELDFVVREIVCSGDGEGLVLVGGRSRQPETGAKLVCLNGQGRVLSTITGVLKGAIRALELDMKLKSLFVGGDGSDIVKFEIGNELVERKRLHIDGPYEGAILNRAIGLTDGQSKTLKELGASL